MAKLRWINNDYRTYHKPIFQKAWEKVILQQVKLIIHFPKLKQTLYWVIFKIKFVNIHLKNSSK